ncbi:MAG: hypothetical protein K6357_02365 [Elusimicrobiota bacterium]
MSLSNLLKKTGIKDHENQNLFKLGLFGFLSIIFSFLISCNKNGVKQEESSNNLDANVSTSTYKIEKATTSLKPLIDNEDTFGKKNCGPIPGYPCGTKYYTVSIRDFSKA